jgi:hypothetical protein
MGKATIIESLGEGKYLIMVEYDTRNTDRRIAKLEETLVDLQWKLTGDYYKEGDEYKTTELKILYVEKELEFLRNIPRTQQLATFCVDYSKELRGAVGTIETHGEVGQSPFHKVLIQPGWEEKNTYDPPTDGILATIPEQFPEQWLVNTMLYPGWQRWKTMFRIGKILDINQEADLAKVELDDAFSSAVLDGKKLDINDPEQKILEDIPIEYMNCHSDAFDVDDRVVVEFVDQSWAGQKKIIGFESNPKACPLYLQVSVNDTLVNYNLAQKYVRIAQHNPDTGELETIQQLPVGSAGEPAGICGPFDTELLDPGRPFYAELYYRGSYSQSRPVYWFNYFELATEQNHDFHVNFAVRQNPTAYYAAGIHSKVFTVLSDDNLPWFFPERIIEEYDHYVNRVEWNRSDEGNLHGAQTVKIDSEAYGTIRVLKVNFTCRAIRYHHRGWTNPDGTNYNEHVYQNCRMHGEAPRYYEELAYWNYYHQDLAMIHVSQDPEMWSYCTGFMGDFNDGVWNEDPTATAKIFPQSNTSPISFSDVWYSGGEWFVGGSGFLSYFDHLGQDIFTNPFIISDQQGNIISEPMDTTIRMAWVASFSAGYCIDFDEFNDCIEYEVTCDRSYGCVDVERHLHEFQVVDLPQELI